MRVKEAELLEKEKYVRRVAAEEELSGERRESEFQERLRNVLSRQESRYDSKIGQTDKERVSNRDIPIKQEMTSGKEMSEETMTKKICGDPLPSLIKKSADCSNQIMDTAIEIKLEHASDGASRTEIRPTVIDPQYSFPKFSPFSGDDPKPKSEATFEQGSMK